ncbi:MAG: hypothetical protein ACRD0K_09315 [Egibacteraceae bacterium]
MTYHKVRTVVASSALAALMVLGSAPAAHADPKKGGPTQDNDSASAQGGNGGDGGLAIGIGICAIQIAVIGNAGCANNGVADASGGNGGNATAIADQN